MLSRCACHDPALSIRKQRMSSKAAPGTSEASSSTSAAGALREPGRLADAVRDVVIPIAAVVVLFLGWEGAVQFFRIPSYIIPAPTAIWSDTIAMGPSVYAHVGATLKTVLLGFALSVVASFPIAIAIT